ncbi:MAG: valine--tRNA ligase [Oligoflexia bacterium]|nr:valine--tRNA ligase [Oligoflexia bacterium]
MNDVTTTGQHPIIQNELSKTYNPKEVEAKWYPIWKNGKYFKPKKGKTNKTYSIIMPPPNVTGKLHMGHALDNTLQDALIRFKRMKGFETLWIPGADHAGIATQAVVEKKIWDEQRKTRHQIGRKEFLKTIWQWKDAHQDFIINQLEKLGVSTDWDYFVFTMDPIPNEAVRKVFVEWYNEGLIFQTDYIINWDPVLQSAISDAEVEHKEVKGAFHYIKYMIKDISNDSNINHIDHLIIATTRPETLLGDTAVAVNPEDERFKHLIGKKVIIPIVNREVPIIGDNHVDISLGTGCLKVTPGHDFNDFEIGKRHNLPLVNILERDGRLNNIAPAYQGLTVLDARAKIIKELEDQGLYFKKEECTHQIGHGERSGSIVEPMVSKQWFVNVKKMAQDSVSAVETDLMRFYHKSWENTFFAWLKEPRDWCISRQLWWGHQIPVFYCENEKCNHLWASVNNLEAEEEQGCPKCKNKKITQDPDVLDTWFSSGLWALSTLGWPNEKAMKEKSFAKFFPTSTLVTGFDIIFFWVARMMMMTLKNTNQVPFHHTYIHAIVRDKHGRKMSKSLGNGIDPLDIIEQYGTDALRFTLAAGSGYNRYINLDPAQTEGYRNFINKLWNAFRFIHPFIKEEHAITLDLINSNELIHHDRWILSELNAVIDTCNKAIDEYRFDDTSLCIYSFVYDKFCSWYIELSKPILYGDDLDQKRQRISILKYIFRNILSLLHPITPFITEELWENLKEEGEDLLIVQEYPEANEKLNFTYDQHNMNKFVEIVTAIRNLRQSVNIKPKDEVEIFLFIEGNEFKDYIEKSSSSLNDLAKIKKLHSYLLNEKSFHSNDGSSGESNAKSGRQNIPAKSISIATSNCEIYLPLSGLIDVDEYVNRLKKDLIKTETDYGKLQAKLGNKNFSDNAPIEVVTEVKEKALELGKKLNSLKTMLNNF